MQSVLLQIPAKPVISPRMVEPRTVEPRTVEELLELNNATRYIDILIEAGYDDINFICETSDEELKELGMDGADREEVIYYLYIYI